MSSVRSARVVEVEAGEMPFASESAPHGGSRRGAPLPTNAREEKPRGVDQVCSHCGFARGVHAYHCPVFAAALDAGAARQETSGALPAGKDHSPSGDDLGLERRRRDPARPDLIEPQPKVLVADDHPVHRQWSRAIFEALACSVAVVEDGAAALALCAIEAFDLLLVDRHMPVLGGNEAVLRLRANGGPSSRAYVASCSSDPPGDLAAGYDATAPKPLDVDAACSLLTEALTAAATRAKHS